MWSLIARFLARPRVSAWVIARAQRTPYFHLAGYMERWWLVPYRNDAPGCGSVSFWRRPIAWTLQRFDIAIRVHHILRADVARHPHDHPWNARTFILRGWYREHREGEPPWAAWRFREAGETATLKFGEYHHIEDVGLGGVWTLFVTTKYRGTWGFLVDGAKVRHTDYPA